MRWIPKHARPRLPLGRARVVTLTAGAVLCVSAVVGGWAALGHDSNTAAVTSPSTVIPSATHTSATPSPAATSASASATPDAVVRPVSLDIPSIKVHTTLQMLNLDASGALQPPTNLTQAGWYTGSPVPGQNGPSVIAGHVDSVSGPAVFFELGSLKPGDAVTIGLSSGHSVTFYATSVGRYSKTQFPTEAVYGARPDPELRLITCGGGFAAGHYLDNVVVYATEAAPAKNG